MMLFDGWGHPNNSSNNNRASYSSATTTAAAEATTATRRTLLFLLSLLALLLGTASAAGTYSVVAPNILRPNRDFSVVVSSHGTEGVTRMGVEITGNPVVVGGSEFKSRQEALLQPDTTQLLKFQMGDLDHGDYHLSVSGSGGGLEFRNITSLKFEPKSYSVFVETDRGLYQPGDLVKFRVVVVNPNLRPSVTGAIDILVQDGSGTTVMKYPRVFTNKGVWTNQLQLSREPVLGDWTIVVSVLGQVNRGGFLVAEFVKPKFEVSLELPDYLSLEDENMTVFIHASYPYGRPIKGEVTLQVTPRYQYEYLQAPYDAPVSVVRQMKGSTSIELRLNEDLGLRGDYARVLSVTAYVKEQLTDRVQNASSSVTVYRFPYNINFIRSSDTFKPGLKYTAYLHVSYQDGRPVTSGEITVRHAFVRDEAAFISTTHSIPDSGTIALEVHPPATRPGPSWTLAFEARYENLTQWLGELPRAQSPSGTYLQATLLTDVPTVGEEVLVALNSTETLVYFVYEVLARGDVIHASTLQAHSGHSHTFRFIASGTMFPKARLMVHYVREDGEMVADSLHFAVQRSPRDKVTLTVTPSAVDTGGDGLVSISVSARPNSLIGVASMDSANLAITGAQYRMDKTDIIKELESYDPGQTPWGTVGSSSHGRRSRRALRTEMLWYGTATAHDVFQNAGVVMMTNARVYREDPIGSGSYFPGHGPIDGRGWDPENLPPAHNGPFGRVPQLHIPGANTLRPDLGPGLEYSAPPRPPLAGPYAFSFFPPPPDNKPRVFLSTSMNPSWLFTHRQTGLNGILTWQEKAPKQLSRYTITAFAIDDFDGLTIAESPAVVTTYRPFYVSVRVPSSVMRGEAVAVEAVVFNHVPDNMTATVTISNEDGLFLFPDFSNQIDQGSPAVSKSRTVSVAGAGGRTPLSFMIVPQKLGPLRIKVTAVAGPYSDTETQIIKVKAEGSTLYVNKALYISPSTESSFSRVLNITLPRNIVEDSLHIEVSAMGDLLGGAATSLEHLLRLPTGCGEQNMATMIPIMIVLKHLRSVGELSRSLEERAVAELQLRFQQQLTYRQKDGSFATFDEYRTTKGGTWLTAFVAKSLRVASDFIDVPREVIVRALSWLVKQQQADGSFSEPQRRVEESNNNGAAGDSSYPELTGALETPLTLTSFVLLAILEVEDYSSVAVRNAGNRALEYLSSLLQGQESSLDTYGLSIATYALHVADHPYKDTAFYMLEAKATVRDGMKWWSDGSEGESFTSTEEGSIVSSAVTEQTAYGLLTYTRRSLVADSDPIVRWLTLRRNEMGGFSSTQDTAVGLTALSALSQQQRKASGSNNNQLTVKLVYGERGHRFIINNNNARNPQTLVLPKDTRSIELSSSGDRRAIVQLSYHYNVQVTAPRPAFSLDPQLDRTTDTNKLRLTACTALRVRGNASEAEQSSNMAVMEVALPSGYLVDSDAIYGLYDYPGVKRVEWLRGEEGDGDMDTGLAIYFNGLTSREVCPTITASRVNRVAFQKPTVIKVYDYYDLTRQSRQFYDAAAATLCDICDIGECDSSACEVQILELNRQRQDPEDVGYPATIIETSAAAVLSWNAAFIAATALTATLLHLHMHANK